MDSAFKLFFVKPTKLELDMFVVTFNNQFLDKFLGKNSTQIMGVLTLKRASESPSVVLVMRKKRVNNGELWGKADMSVVSTTLTPVYVACNLHIWMIVNSNYGTHYF